MGSGEWGVGSGEWGVGLTPKAYFLRPRHGGRHIIAVRDEVRPHAGEDGRDAHPYLCWRTSRDAGPYLEAESARPLVREPARKDFTARKGAPWESQKRRKFDLRGAIRTTDLLYKFTDVPAQIPQPTFLHGA